MQVNLRCCLATQGDDIRPQPAPVVPWAFDLLYGFTASLCTQLPDGCELLLSQMQYTITGWDTVLIGCELSRHTVFGKPRCVIRSTLGNIVAEQANSLQSTLQALQQGRGRGGRRGRGRGQGGGRGLGRGRNTDVPSEPPATEAVAAAASCCEDDVGNGEEQGDAGIENGFVELGLEDHDA